MKILDCFSFYNEKELLELRVKLLYDKVDLFVISDANRTHSGIPKEYTCKEIIKRFNLPKNKIEIVEVDLPGPEIETDNWNRERLQRNAAQQYIDQNTVAIVSDCDEIIDPTFIDYYSSLAQNNPDNILRIPMSYLNCRADLEVCDSNGNKRPWSAGFICLHNHIQKYTLSDIRESFSRGLNHIPFRDIYAIDNGTIQDAGWHFSWMGDTERLKTKCRSFGHAHEIVHNAVAPLYSNQMTEFLNNYRPTDGTTDPLGRNDHILKSYPVEKLPQLIFENPNLKEFLLP